MIKLVERALLGRFRLVLGAVLLLYLSVSGVISWSSLERLLEAWPLTLLAFLLVLGDHLTTALRLRILLQARALNLSLADSIRLTLIGTFFNACLPGSVGGDAFKIYYASAGARGKRIEVATVMMLDRVVGLFTLLTWPLVFAPFFSTLVGASDAARVLLVLAGAMAAGVLAMLLLGMALATKGRRLVSRLLAFLPFGIGARVERMLETVHLYHRNPGALAAALGVSFLSYAQVVGATLVVARVLYPADFDWTMVFFIPLGFLGNALPVTPGGLGVGEAVFENLFALFGLPGGAETLLGWRVLNVLVGLIGLFFYLQRGRRFISRSLDPGTENAPLPPTNH
jgi:uncharacterized protein (TIRG00374 family)